MNCRDEAINFCCGALKSISMMQFIVMMFFPSLGYNSMTESQLNEVIRVKMFMLYSYMASSKHKKMT